MDIQDCQWINEPSEWKLKNDVLYVTTNSNTDFWRKTHYGFTRHSGHVFGCYVAGDFTLQLCIEGEFEEFNDQVGLMIEQDTQHWC